MLHATMVADVAFSLARKGVASFLGSVVVLLGLATAEAQSWKDALLAEQAKNNTRIDQIDKQGEPIAASLRANTAAIARHNAVHPSGVCTYPEGRPEVCAPWIAEAKRLNTEQATLRGRLIPLVNERDRLVARNQEIARRLRCVPLPQPCGSNADCNECSSCSTFDGRGKTGICQPRP
jgi:hypothetical protein